MLDRNVFAVLVLCVATFAQPAQAQSCSVTSGAQRASLVELYTSEGCDSCPPADKWLSTLKTDSRAIALSYHVDYWDYIGWKDRFASPKFGERQRMRVAAQGSRSVYTPQVMVNGRDAIWRDGEVALRIGTQTSAATTLKIDAKFAGDSVNVVARSDDNENAKVMIAVYENGLRSNVKAGENKGVTLQHDFVVRAMIGPVAPGRHALKVPADVVIPNAGVAVWAEDGRGALLQAVKLPLAGC